MTAWQVLARKGELVPQVALWIADLVFQEPRGEKRYAILWLSPLKKKRGRQEHTVAQSIEEFYGGGSDTCAALRRVVEYSPVPSAVVG